MKTSFNQGIGIFENIFSYDFCESLIKLTQKYAQLNQLYGRKKIEGGPIHKKDYGFDLDYENPEHQPFAKHITNQLLYKVLPIYSEEYVGFNQLEQIYIPRIKVQRTNPGEGYHVWHCEHANSLSSSRAAAYTIYLNTVDSGGETEFLEQHLRIPSLQGSVCIFPSSYTHLHRGNPPLFGEKYIVTGWLEFNMEEYDKDIIQNFLKNNNSH